MSRRLTAVNKLSEEIVWNYQPTDRQLEAHKNRARYRLYGGAMGGGKSVWLVAEAFRLSLRYPGNRGFICRKFLQDLKATTLVTFDEIIPRAAIADHHRDDRIIRLQNGSEILYGGLGSKEDIERIKSAEFGWFAIDEATEVLESHFNMLATRLRWKVSDGSRPEYFGLLTANPEPGWVKRRFVDTPRPKHAFIPALPRDNPHLPEDYDETLRITLPEGQIKRYLDGSWDIFEGQIYTEFTRDIHVVSNDVEIPKGWDHFRALDHGYVNPTACLWIAVDGDGRMWVYDEHYESGLTVHENAQVIKAKQPDFKGLTIADPSIFNRTVQTKKRVISVADEYREAGIICRSPYENTGRILESVGIQMVKQRLKSNSLFIKENCQNTIDEMVGYRWAEFREEDLEKKNAREVPIDKDNHAMDALRYAVCWKPQGKTQRASRHVPATMVDAQWEKIRREQRLRRRLKGRYAGWRM